MARPSLTLGADTADDMNQGLSVEAVSEVGPDEPRFFVSPFGNGGQHLVSKSVMWLPAVGVCLFLLLNRNLGWLPNDDGTLMQTALRVGTGEIPHVDFHEPYTGGLGYLNAVALSIFGETMASLRWPFLISIVGWVVSLVLLGRRFMPPAAASVLVPALALGSVFLHLSPIPSWYNLFLGTWSIHLVVKYAETRRLGFLFTSGLLVGISTVFKTTGVYFGMAVWVIAVLALMSTAGSNLRKTGLTLAFLPVLVSVIVVSAEMTIARMISLLLPIASVVILGMWISARSDKRDEDSSLALPLGLLLAAAAVLPLAGLGMYAINGHTGTLIDALLVVPSSYIDQLSLDNAHPLFLLVPTVAFLGIRILASLGQSRGAIAVALCGTSVGFLFWSHRAGVLSWGLVGLASLGFVGAALFVGQRKRVALTEKSDFGLFAVTCASVFFGLIAFPHAGPYYDLYAFPLAAVAVAGWAFKSGLRHGYLTVGLLVVLCLIFGVNKLSGGWFADATTAVDRPHVALQLEGFGLVVPVHYQFYEPLVEEIDERVAGGQTVLAGPDAPEIYALTSAPNPTPIMFELISRSIDPIYSSFNQFRIHRPDLYVLNTNPAASNEVDDLKAALSECEMIGAFGFYELHECS
ncbi:hypothetical protein BH23ACT4_BH23ACT4_01230 [soil metagenome]